MARKSISRSLGPALLAAVIFATVPTSSAAKETKKTHPLEQTNVTPAALWRNPTDIASRDLFYGPGGKDDAPHTVFTFIKEDHSGTNPKFDVHDENGVKWKVKLGVEARPETVATRLVWAVGYYANEDYFLRELRVENLPHLTRGQSFVGPDGTIQNVRLKRFVEGEKKVGVWKWRDNPFTRQREFNGLRVMMALLNNWDLKDENNAVYDEKSKDADDPKMRYLVSDLGASFGTAGRSLTHSASKGNLQSYRHSKFISKVTSEYVDFNVPSRPALIFVFTPKEFASRMDMRWIGKRIPRSDAKWIGGLLAQLSPAQIRDAFLAADYSPEQVEAFAAVVEKRIAELNRL